MKSDISIATSGYAGSSNIKDSSCSIFISCCIDKFNFTEKINLKGTRNEIGKRNRCNFDCFYFCYKINLKKDIICLVFLIVKRILKKL